MRRRLYIITRQNHNYYTLKVVLRWSPCCNVFGNLTGVGVIILYTNTPLTCREMMSPSRLIIRSGNSLLLTRRTIVLLPTLLVCYISSLVLCSVFSCYLKVWCVLVCSNVWSSSSILVVYIPVLITCLILTSSSSILLYTALLYDLVYDAHINCSRQEQLLHITDLVDHNIVWMNKYLIYTPETIWLRPRSRLDYCTKLRHPW